MSRIAWFEKNGIRDQIFPIISLFHTAKVDSQLLCISLESLPLSSLFHLFYAVFCLFHAVLAPSISIMIFWNCDFCCVQARHLFNNRHQISKLSYFNKFSFFFSMQSHISFKFSSRASRGTVRNTVDSAYTLAIRSSATVTDIQRKSTKKGKTNGIFDDWSEIRHVKVISSTFVELRLSAALLRDCHTSTHIHIKLGCAIQSECDCIWLV